MKILTNKGYRGLVDRQKLLEESILEYQKKIKNLNAYNYELLEDKDKYYKGYKDLQNINAEHLKLNSDLRKAMDTLKVKHHKSILEKNKEIKVLKKALEDTTELLEKEKKLRKGEYTIKRLRADTTKSKQEMGVKRVCKNNQETKRLKELNKNLLEKED